jgi:hypothetical protein
VHAGYDVFGEIGTTLPEKIHFFSFKLPKSGADMHIGTTF